MSGEIPAEVYEAAARALNIVWGYDQTLDAEDFERAVATDAQGPALRKAVDTGYAAGVAAGRAQAAADIRALNDKSPVTRAYFPPDLHRAPYWSSLSGPYAEGYIEWCARNAEAGNPR